MIDSHRDEIAKLESLYAMNPEGRVFTHLAEACRKAGHLDRARQILQDGLQRHPDYASAHVVLGRVLTDSGEDDAAVGEFRRVLELDRHNLVALRSLGELASRAGRNEEAIHYYGELAVLDPTDPEIQETLRGLRDRASTTHTPAQLAGSDWNAPAAAAVTEDEPAGSASLEEPESETDAAEAATTQPGYETPADMEAGPGADESAPADEIVIESHLPGEYEVDVAPLEGLESTASEPEPSDAWPTEGAGDLPEWPAAEESQEADQPGEHAPIDHAAWEAIGAAGEPERSEAAYGADLSASAEPDFEPQEVDEGGPETSSEPYFQPESEFEAETEARVESASADVTMPPLDEDHLRFVPPGMFGRPADQEEEIDGEEGEGEEIEAAEDAPEVEGRWQPPESSHVDAQAERSRPTDHSGEWIPEDRWEWVAASADRSGSGGAPEPDEAAAEESSPETKWESGPPEYDAETSFAGLTDDDDVPAAYGIDDEISFAGLADDDELTLEGGSDEETSFAGIADGEPVDSFEEGAAAVLDAFARSGDEPEGDDRTAEEPPEPSFVTSAEADDEPPVSWVTESEDDGDLVITETLAEIYASQGLYDRAAAVYRRLIGQHPDDDRLQARLADLESATGWAGEAAEPGESTESEEERDAFLERVESAWTGGQGAAGTEDSLYAWAGQEPGESEAGPRVGDYFADLLAWRPVQAVPSDAYEGLAEPSSLTEDWYAEEADREPVAEEGEVGREGEEDLEMFRSWLKSLKK